MDSSKVIRDISGFMDALDATDTPFLKMIPPLPAVGEKDRYGRTLLGFTEVDHEEKNRIHAEWYTKRMRLDHMYHEQGFQLTDDYEHDGYYEPIQTPESLALKDEVDSLWYQYVRMNPQPIWDREIEWPKKVTWGMSTPKGNDDAQH